MASRLLLYAQKIFGINHEDSPEGQIAKFGSQAAGTPAYSSDLGQIQSLSQYLDGWLSASVSDKSPTAQDFNALFYLITHQLATLIQCGVPEYVEEVTYFTGSLVKSDNVIYQATSSAESGISGIAPGNTTYWTPYHEVLAGKMPGVAKAWGHFTDDGTTLTLVTSYNVSGFSRLSTGAYQATFPAGLIADQSYCYSLSNEQNDSSGSAQLLTRFPGDTKTPTQFTFRNVNATDSNNYRVTEGCFVIWR